MYQTAIHSICPLCQNTTHIDYFSDAKRHYRQCTQCQLVWVPAPFHLSPKDEKAEYDKHQNSLDDVGYLTFLARVSAPLLKRLPPHSRGLDYGCGPAPALAEQLKSHGHSVALYDLYYFPDSSVLHQKYDFITCTEVIEHIARPRELIKNLVDALKSNGILAIMTKRVRDKPSFSTWHYKNDPTHIAFYSEQTFAWLAQQWQLKLEIIDNDVVFLTKS
jgi:SAM-dependent methyltransferase